MRCCRKILGITTTGSAILHLMKIVFICVTCNRDCHLVAPQVTTDVVSQWSVFPSSHYTEGDRWWILSWVFFIRPKYDNADSGNLLVNPESWTLELSSRNPESSTWNPKSTAFQSLSYLGWHYPFAMRIVVCYAAVLCVITQRSFLETKMASLFAFLHVIGHFRVPKTLTFKMRLGAQPFLWKWVSFAWEWKTISISKAEHLFSFWNRVPAELGNGLFTNGLRVFTRDRYSCATKRMRCKMPSFIHLHTWL